MTTDKPISTTTWDPKPSIVLGVLLCVFAIAKLAHIYTPLFHDELEVYGRAVFYMLDHGPSMIPADMDTDLSRGHPLFFVFFTSLLTGLFGGTYMAARVVMLLVAMGVIVSTYFLGKEIVSKKVGLLAAIMLSFQPLFFTQSTLILPEVMLTLLGILSLLFYLKKKYLLYFIFASLLILTKETGIVLFAGIVLNEWYKNRFRISFKLIGEAFKWSAPLSCFVIFLIVQKQQHGWYLYPYHTGFISFEPEDILGRFLLVAKHLFHDQGRFMLLILMLIDVLKMNKKEFFNLFHINFLTLVLFFMFFSFSSLNYFMARYEVLLLPLLMIFVLSVLRVSQTNNYKHFLLYFILTLPFQYNLSTFSTDDNMNYLITVENMKESIAELDKKTGGKPAAIFAILPEKFALQDPRYGYTNNPNYSLLHNYSDSCDYILRGSHNFYDRKAVLRSPIDTILNNKEALDSSSIKEIYSKQLYFSTQRIFKANN
jgi:4-amino-4-deoxy-L-arabinose transferase-like glycosyltransferase